MDLPLPVTLQPGMLHVFIGPNGCGKSSLLRAIALRRGVLGKYRIVHDAYRSPGEVAFLPQSPSDLADVNVRGLERLAERVSPRESKRSSPRRLGSVAGGERQLLLFRAVSRCHQSVHIYDEPYQHLDREGVGAVSDALARSVESGKLVLIAEHRVECLNGIGSPVRRIELT